MLETRPRTAPDLDNTVLEREATVAARLPESRPPGETSAYERAEASCDETFEARYEKQELIASGGMGEVVLVHDARIGRDVAMKVIKRGIDSDCSAELRFIREARVQGRLEHPSIVPVYDLGATPHGTSYFTMRHVRGKTVREIVDSLSNNPDGSASRCSRRKLLTAFSAVCLAVDFAHKQGVVHRDLKPSNIMLGDFGEVYLLDWGLAKVITEKAESKTPIERVPLTEIGWMLGTAGYMAPEQTLHANAQVDARADVYALGATLFEILTLERLHPQATTHGKIDSTRSGANARASGRTPDRNIPPELDAICVRATATRPEDRYQSAREMHDAIERFLDGDRDVEIRIEMANAHTNAAEKAVERVITGKSRSEEKDRSFAMREIGRALALDPKHERATQAMVRLLLEPPKHAIHGAKAMIGANRDAACRISSRHAVIAYSGWLLFTPLCIATGVKTWISTFLWVGIGLTILVNLLGIKNRFFLYAKSPLGLIMTSAVIAVLSRIFGPLIFIPTIAVANAIGYAVTPHKWMRPLVIVCGCASFLGPLALEWTHLIAPSYVFLNGGIATTSALGPFPATAAIAFLTLSVVASVIIASWYMFRTSDALSAAEEKLQLYAWHLGQLVPESARVPPADDGEG
jgi:eukaryotic-like serine/threonine-protein kinase